MNHCRLGTKAKDVKTNSGPRRRKDPFQERGKQEDGRTKETDYKEII